MSKTPKADRAGAGEPAARKPYVSPRLADYGDLRRIALAKGKNKQDGSGNPATKA